MKFLAERLTCKAQEGHETNHPQHYARNENGEVLEWPNDSYAVLHPRRPDWSPDSTKIVWRTGQFGDSGEIAVMNADGTGAVNLTNDLLVYDAQPAWASDGTRIAYASVQGSDSDIRLMNPDGTGKGTITTSSGQDYDPDWGPTSGPPPSTFALTVTKSGQGSVSSAPSGIKCGRDCSESYAAGTAVVLTAKAGRGYSFTGWSGACSGTGTCTVTMNAAKTVTATFSSG
ncbi:MAG: hypothetical protein ABR609_00205 [Acidimicrobiia bacterium]